MTLLQLQQREAEKGAVRQVQPVGAGRPPLLSQVPHKTPAKDKKVPGARALPPIVAVPSEIAASPMIPITEIPTDLCGQKIGDASAYGWGDPTSHALTHGAGLGAEHGLCRHIASNAAPSAGR